MKVKIPLKFSIDWPLSFYALIFAPAEENANILHIQNKLILKRKYC